MTRIARKYDSKGVCIVQVYEKRRYVINALYFFSRRQKSTRRSPRECLADRCLSDNSKWISSITFLTAEQRGTEGDSTEPTTASSESSGRISDRHV